MYRLLRTGFLIVSLAACSTLGVCKAQAGPMTPGYEYATEANNAGGQMTVGEKFQANTAITITALGLGDFAGLITYNHPVGLWDASGNLLASTTVNVGQTPIGHFQYQTLNTPVHLAAGAFFVVGAQIADPSNPGGAADPYANQLFGFTVNPNVTFVDTRVHDALALMFPERMTPSGAVAAQPQFGTNAYEFGTFSANFLTPEPASMTMMVVGLLGLSGAAWSKRRPALQA